MQTGSLKTFENQAKNLLWLGKKLLPLEIESTIYIPLFEVDKEREIQEVY